MSFGFSVGDFLVLIQLANKIRKDFVGAPNEFKGALDVVGSLSIILQSADVAASERILSPKDETDLQTIRDGCQNTLSELERTLGNYTELESQQTKIGGKLKRAWKRLSLEPEDIRNLRTRVNDNITLLSAFTLRQTRVDISKLVRFQENQEQRTTDHEQKAILDWLTPFNYFPQQNDFIKQRQAGTGQWLLDSAEYKSWVGANKQTLFCPGIPGAGKTILTSIVVDDLSTRFQGDTSAVIAYVYCNFKRQIEQTLEDLLASLLKQMAQGRPSLPDGIRLLHDQCKSKNARPSVDDILKVFQSVAAEYSRVFILVDALDECGVIDGCQINLLSQISELQTNNVNIFATSRFIPDITERFEGDLVLEIRANKQDVQRYVKGHIDELPRFVQRDPDLQQEISSEIVKATDGMFLLAQLHLNSLKGKRAPTAIRDALKKLPTGSEAYDRAYSAAMERIEGQISDQEELAKEALAWITCAKRPLTTLELQHALAVKVGQAKLDIGNIPDIEDIVSVCAGLITVDKESGIIRLVHYTTQEYFERTQKIWFPTADFIITAICVTYLSFTDFSSGFCQTDSSFEERLSLNPLYDYTAHYWGRHARQASSLHPQILKFLQCTINVEAAAQVLLARKHHSPHSNYSQEVPKHITSLHLAAYFGIAEAVALILQGADVDSKITDGRTSLSWAARKGHGAVVQLPLDTGKVDVDVKDGSGRTPLSYAATNGHEAVVQLLLDTYRVDVNMTNRYGQTPLLYAAENGHEAVVQLLLDTGKVDVNLKDSLNQTPLSHATTNGHEAVVQLLLNTGKVDVNLKDSFGQTPLSHAVRKGYEAVIQLLLDTGKADVNLKNNFGQTPLSYAAENGHEAVIQLLLDTGKANVNLKDSYGQTPLLLAAEMGYEAVVQLLLDTGKADVNLKDSYGRTPLFYAAVNGHKAVIQLLLDTGKANVNLKDSSGQTLLSHAAVNGHEAVIQLLLDTGKG